MYFPFQVFIGPYRWDTKNSYIWTEMRVAGRTTIGELQTMKIFEGGIRQCPPDSFTLGDCWGSKELKDDATVESITPGVDHIRYLVFYSCSYRIQKEGSKQSEIKTFVNGEFPRVSFWCNVIGEQLSKGSKRKKRIHSTMTLPGGTILGCGQ